jgi:1-acyl-sn-glycerol-3-phosphate acyltransferase
MGAQSALFSPSKLGSIPELLHPEKISAANGLFGLATVSATVIGMVIGSTLSDATGWRGQERWWLSALVLWSIAIVGLTLSLLIRRLPIANPTRTFPWDAFRQQWRDLHRLGSNVPLRRVALGIVFFWSVGALAQMNIDQFAFEGGATVETDKIPLLISLVLGVGFGSVLAGIWSGNHIELGILPLGAFGVAICSMLLFTAAGVIIEPGPGVNAALVWACFLLLMLGISAGLFSVPLEAYLQHRSPPRHRGSILAATNFLVFGGILISALAFWVLRRPAFDGSLENIAAVRQQAAQLSDTERRQVAAATADFQRFWDDQPEPDGGPALSEAEKSEAFANRLAKTPAAARDVAIAELLWVELRHHVENDMFLSKYDYYERFTDPDETTLAKEVVDQATGLPLMTARQIFLLSGLFTLPVFLYIIFLIPQASVRFVLWLASNTVYRLKVTGLENLPERGGALLVANHVSWLDGILLLLTSSRPVRVLAFGGYLRKPLVHGLAKLAGVIPIDSGPKKVKRALDEARQALDNGEIVGIFPEGGITRTGHLQAFKPGLMRIVDGIDVPVIPVYLDELWGSIFSFHGGRFFWKWPRKWPYRISIHFGPPVQNPSDVHQVRRAVQDLGAMAVQQRSQNMTLVTESFLRTCKKQKWRRKAADTTGMDLTGGQLLMRTLLARRLLLRDVLDDDETHVGVLLPPSAGAIAINVAITLLKRTSVNLNYTVTPDVMNSCIEQAGIRRVLTTRKFMEKINLQIDTEIVYLDDLREKLTLWDKLSAATAAYAMPAGALVRSLKIRQAEADDVVTVIFTSGSTGQPKGVMLTYANVASNVAAINQAVHLTPDDTLVGVLPFFHSFGYTITLWTVMTLDVKGVYHFNPLDARQVGKMCRKFGGTILLATPTFLRSYLRRCEKQDFESLDVVVTGAERLPKELAGAFENKFGVRPIEGYGCTETAPLVSVNIPPTRSFGNLQVERKEGTVGRPVDGVSAKTIDLKTGEDQAAGQTGMLMITGPNIMKGYLGRPDLTEEAIIDGWYKTGDIALIDDDGFITITGRESRFSKIGGEMVPHIQIEELLSNLIGSDEEEGLKAAVTAVPDARKGERLVVIHTRLDKSADQLCDGLRDKGMPNIFIPSPDSFLEVDELPILGTGKLDLKGLRKIALERLGIRE